jgi:transaldolase / glucose-6-phosphate isomerase
MSGSQVASSNQTLFPGRLQNAYRRELDHFIISDALRRLWSKDISLWPHTRNGQELSANLTWLDLPHYMGKYMERVGNLVPAMQRQGFQDVVFIAIGDSNLAMDAISRASAEIRCRRVFLLDSIDPAAIRSVDQQLDYASTLFIFANKSGKRIENHSLLLHFLDRVKSQGITDPGRCFIAVTEQGSYLESHAKSYGFLATFLDPPGIKGRYSSLIHFGLLLSTLWRFEPADLQSRSQAMRDWCQLADPPEANPALTLAALLAACANEGHDKLLLLSSPSLEASTHRIGQLVGTSTSKGGRGLIPISGAVPTTLEPYQAGAMTAVLRMRGDDDAQVKEVATRLEREGVPFVSAELETPADLGAEVFKWEVATALACASLNVNPFDEPDTQVGREKSAAIVEGLTARGELPTKKVRVQERGIELYAESATRQQISTLSLPDALRTFFELRRADGYLAIISFVGESNENGQAALRRVREQIASRLGIPVLLSAGPRYLPYFEQVYKGGPSKGMFLILTGDAVEDISIPGAGYTFGQLQLALAMGDFDALESRQKLVIRLHLTRGAESGLDQVEQVIQQALTNTRGITR